jgi:hypothetical protein
MMALRVYTDSMREDAVRLGVGKENAQNAPRIAAGIFFILFVRRLTCLLALEEVSREEAGNSAAGN